MSYTIYIYGREVHDDYQAISYEMTEAAAWASAEDCGYGNGWISRAITCIADCKGDERREFIYNAAVNHVIETQIAEAIRVKRVKRNRYVAPTLAGVWPA
jgi:hypothetical protein